MEAFDGAFVAGNASHHDLAEFGCWLNPHDDEVTIEDASIDHGVTANPQHEEFAIAGELGGDWHELFDAGFGATDSR